MSNNYYNHGSFPSTGSAATSASMRGELDLVMAGFDKLPTLTGNANKFVLVNPSGTGLIATSTLPATTVNDTIFTFADNVDSTKTFQFDAAGISPSTLRTFTMPDANTTLVGTATTQTLTNKTYNGLTLTANATGFSLAGGTTSKTLTLNNTLTFSGTDGSTLNIGAGGTLGTAAYATIANYATLASPTFTGVPAAPTAAVDTNTTQLATTAYVVGQGYSKLASPTFTGTPAAPTAAVDTNTTQLATTAYVIGQGYLKSATASSTYAPLASPTFTGTPAAPTAAADTNTTQLATTAYVIGQGYLKSATASSTYLQLAGGTMSGKLTISKSTSVTVGTASGSDQFEVNNAGSGGAIFGFHRTGAYAINMGLDTDNVFRLGGWSDGLNVYRWTADSSGNFVARGNVTAYSDIRLKTDLQQIPDALAKVEQLIGYTYTRVDSGERQTGLVAQDVQKVLPEAVLPGEHLSLAYGNLVGLLVEAIKELSARVKELEAA